MEAPKKIYVSIGPRQSLVAKAGITLKSDKEYVNKDALLEWAKTKLSHIQEDFDVYTGQRIILRELIEKIESL